MNLSHEDIVKARVEAILFAAPKPLYIADIADILSNDELYPAPLLQKCATLLKREYDSKLRGFELKMFKGGSYQFQTRPHFTLHLERLFSIKPRPLSRAAMETLCIIAYKQPITRMEIEFVRGVDAGSIVKNLLERELIKNVGRKDAPGKPMLFATTPNFLQVFGIESLKDLPPLSSFQMSAEVYDKAKEKIDAFEREEEMEEGDFMNEMNKETPLISEGLSQIPLQSESSDLEK